MRRSTTFVASTAGALAALLTAGCSGEPSDADITQALASAYKGVGLSDKHLLWAASSWKCNTFNPVRCCHGRSKNLHPAQA